MIYLTDACAKVPAGVFSGCFDVPSCSHVHMFACLFGSELGRRPPVFFVHCVLSCRLHGPCRKGHMPPPRLPAIGQNGLSVQGPTDETSARGSSDCPCRAIRLVNFPRDGHAPSDCASGSVSFPPKSSGAARSGIDDAMGPWLCPQEGDVLLLAHLTVHMDPECLLITRRTYPLRLCYCVTKLHRCFHYDVDSDFVLHSNCRCSENVDVATDKFWPVVTMCRRCSPFPERQDDGNSSAH